MQQNHIHSQIALWKYSCITTVPTISRLIILSRSMSSIQNDGTSQMNARETEQCAWCRTNCGVCFEACSSGLYGSDIVTFMSNDIYSQTVNKSKVTQVGSYISRLEACLWAPAGAILMRLVSILYRFASTLWEIYPLFLGEMQRTFQPNMP